MFPSMVSNSIKKVIKIGNFVYDQAAWKCKVVGITTIYNTQVEKAKVSEIASLTVALEDPNFPKQAYEEIIGEMHSVELPLGSIFLKKTDAVTYTESWRAAWKAYNKHGYETDRPYKISKRKHQVTLRLLPSSQGGIDTIKGLRAAVKYTYEGSLPYAFVFFENGELRIIFEDRDPLIMPSPNHISYEHLVTILSLGLGKKINTDITYQPGTVYYL